MADQRKSTQSTYTKRGRGSCPNCEEVYVCRYKPEKCPKCEFKDMDYSTLLTKLLSFDILLEIREFFKRGHPLTNVINCKIETLKRNHLSDAAYHELTMRVAGLERSYLVRQCRNNINNLLHITRTPGYEPGVQMSFKEELTYQLEQKMAKEHEITEAKVRIGGDGAKMSRIASFVVLSFSLLGDEESIMSAYVLTRSLDKFEVAVSEFPPIMAPAVVGQKLYNTELQKKSVYLNENSQPDGDPAMLHQLVSKGGVDMSTIDKMSQENLVDVCKTCGIVYSGKLKAKMITDIQKLYSSMLVGLCPCHGYNRPNGCTGGFYHLVCRHGCTFGSKLLALTESVRDAADLYLSMKYTPTTFICDSPCGLARHLELRDKELAKKLL
ncbi:hypothetical protein QZH41_017319, partial [Actinostola sp. cb2023]